MKNPYAEPLDSDMKVKIERIAKRSNQSVEVAAAVMTASWDDFLDEITGALT